MTAIARCAALVPIGLVACLESSAPNRPAAFVLARQWAAVPPGDSTRLAAVAVDSLGDTIPTSGIIWSSADTTVAVVDQAGVVRGRAIGATRITAALDTNSAVAQIIVAPPVLAGAGDIAGCSIDADDSTAALLDSIPGIVFTAGDNAYLNGTAAEFANCYDPAWGRHKARTRPAPGNHDYNTAGAAPYYAYFGALAGDSGLGYYSYDFAAWHIVSLNSNIAMAPGSPQAEWLRADLALHPAPCTLAYWHHPRFSSGEHGTSTAPAPLWDALYDANADIVINGHDHTYERFAPQTPSGALDSARGIREFVVGTGGPALYAFPIVRANSEVRDDSTHGVLTLTLHPTGFDWEFVPVAGKTFRDAGSGACH